MKFTLQCAKPFQITPDQIKDMIGEDKLKDIKNSDANPLFKAWVLAHEGESRPNKVGEGNVVVKWSRDIIKNLMSKVSSGLKFFFRHNADSSHGGRQSYGEVVGKGEVELNGVLHGLVVGYFPQTSKEIAEQANSISMEVDAELGPTGRAKEYIAKAVTAITGIALGTASDIPGFAGAVEVGSLQANFPSMIHSLQFNTEVTMSIEEALARATPEQLSSVIRSRRFKADELGFKPEDILGKREKVGDSYKWVGGDLAFNRHFDDILSEHTKEYTGAIEKLSTEKQDYMTRALRHEHKPEIEKALREAKLADPTIKLALANLNDYTPGEDPTKSIGSFVEKYKQQQELMVQSGIKLSDAPTVNVNTPNGAGSAQDKVSDWLPTM